jgi:hypothetical protein
MSRTVDRGTEVIAVSKQDLVAAWSLMERLVVSLHRMGSCYSTTGPDVPLSPEQRQKMLHDLDSFFNADTVAEMAQIRRTLSEYLPGDEAETMSQHMEEQGLYWRPKE